jgi:hypothetical protein
MDSVRIERTGKRPLLFDGEIVAESDGKAIDPDGVRWHEIRVYRTAGGATVLEIAYRTKWRGEDGHTFAEKVEASDVARVLAEHNPTEYVRGFPPLEQYADRQRNLLGFLRGRYLSQCNIINGQLGDEVAETLK